MNRNGVRVGDELVPVAKVIDPMPIRYMISFDYWTWGQPVKNLATRLSTLVTAHLGTITATF